MAGAKVPLIFKIYKGDTLLREETLSQPVIKVGKLSSSHLRLEDDSVSRMHAVIEVSSADDISIIDLGSTKGTIVNGQKVNKATLQEGDLIQLGDIRIELSLGAPEVDDDEVTRVSQTPVAPPPAVPPAAVAPTAAPAAPAPPPPVAAKAPSMAPAASADAAAAAFSSSSPAQFGSVDDVAGSQAVEVAAMLGDSVISVKHVMNPKGGKVSPITYGLFGLGTVFLILAAFSFFKGVGLATVNKESKHRWTEVEKKPAFDWRPKRMSLAFDWLAFGGAAGGVLCMTFGLIRIRNERVEPFFRIGRASGVDFPTDTAPSENFPLVAPSGNDFVFNFGSGMDGEMMLDGQSIKLSELQAQGKARPSMSAPGALEAPIPLKARFRVTSGNQSFLVSSVAQPKRHVAPLFAGLESAVLAFFAASAIFHFGIVGLLNQIGDDAGSMYDDDLYGDSRLSSVQSKPPEDPKQEEELENEGDDNDSGGTGTKMALEEGKMGKKESTRASGQYAMKNNNADPQLARKQAMDQARKAGIMGLMQQQPGGAFASLTGTADFSSGLDDRDVFGGLLGNEVGEMAGGWGYGVAGVGPGGGGTGWGTIGTGNYGTIGHGSGTGSGYGTGSGKGGMRGRKARPPSVNIGTATATGDLDKNIIRRYIRRKLRQIKACYEKELLVKPKIAGTVVTQFQISPQGKVQGATASGMGNKNVESCVASAIRSIQFPKPKGGGYVNVRYPFTFNSGG